MLTHTVIFYDWQGTACRTDGHWHLSPRQVTEHLAMDWRRQRRKINGSNLRKGGAMMALPSVGGEQQTLMLKLGHFAHWLLGIEEGRVPPEKRERLVAMQEALMDAIERQLQHMFGLPDMEPEDFERLPLPPRVLSQMEPEECRAAREAVIEDPEVFQATRLLRLGLPATKVAPVVGRSVYWTRKQARHCRSIGLVPLRPAQQRLIEQPDMFAEG